MKFNSPASVKCPVCQAEIKIQHIQEVLSEKFNSPDEVIYRMMDSRQFETLTECEQCGSALKVTYYAPKFSESCDVSFMAAATINETIGLYGKMTKLMLDSLIERDKRAKSVPEHTQIMDEYFELYMVYHQIFMLEDPTIVNPPVDSEFMKRITDYADKHAHRVDVEFWMDTYNK